MANVAAGWYPDPTGRFEHRYWDGSAWTDSAARGGVQSQDPVAGRASVGPLPAMSSPAGLGAPAATSSRPSRTTQVKVLFLGGVPALIFGFFLLTLTTGYEPTRAAMRWLWLGLIGLIGLIALVAAIIELVKTRQPGHALSRGFAWIALSVVKVERSHRGSGPHRRKHGAPARRRKVSSSPGWVRARRRVPQVQAIRTRLGWRGCGSRRPGGLPDIFRSRRWRTPRCEPGCQRPCPGCRRAGYQLRPGSRRAH